MPRTRAVRSLKQCCYRRIALSFDKYWMRDFDQSLNDMPRLMYVLGPFDNWTTEMVQDLLDTLVAEQCLKRQHFLIILQHSITSLDLSNAGLAANNDNVLATISNRCQKLMSLNLRGLNNISVRDIANMAGQLTQLRSLDLGHTNCNDQVLSVLGHNCQQLMELKLDVTKVTNSGAYSLCQAAFPDRGCKQLVRLSIHGTMINRDGALHCLKNLPKLTYFDFDDICDIIEHDVNDRLAKGEVITPYKLRRITACGFETSKSSISVACQWCLEATEVKLFHEVTANNLQSLTNLKRLTRLCIGDAHNAWIRTDLTVMFNAVGHQLTQLELYFQFGFDLLMIGYHCTNLQKLALFLSNEIGQGSASSFVVPPNSRHLLFRKLESLVAENSEFVEMSSGFVTVLKQALNLKNISLSHNFDWLTNEVFLDILDANPLRHLQTLELKACNGVNVELVSTLLQKDNDLTHIELHECKLIGQKEYKEMLAFAKSRNIDLKISWS